FGAIARAAYRAHLYFVGSVQILEPPLKLNSRTDGILNAEPAELRAHAGLHHAHALGVRLTRGHAQLFPDLRQVFFFDSQQIDALASGDFHHRDLVFFGDIGDLAQLRRRSDASAHARHHAERAIVLNIGVHAVVDEPRRTVFYVVAAPHHVDHVAQCRLA